MPKLLDNRFNVFAVFLLFIFLIVIFQLVNIQIIQGNEYNVLSQKKLLRKQRIVAPRGNVFDRNGIPIATNKISYTVDIIKTNESSSELNKKILRLIKVFDKNGDNYANSLSKYLTINPISYGPYISNSKSILKRWKQDMVGEDDEKLKEINSAKKMFLFLREKFSIDDDYTVEEAYKIMTLRYELLIKGYSILDELNIARDVSKESVFEIAEKSHKFKGIIANSEPVREYLEKDSIAHIVGYVANISNDEYKKLKDDNYYMTDLIGKTGIEKIQENNLRGIDGTKSVEIDVFGNETTQLSVNPSIPGKDITLSIDLKLQKVAMNSLKKTITDIREGDMGGESNKHDAYFGSVVAMDVNSGEVLVMASYPSYDPSIFSADKSDDSAQAKVAALFDPKNKETSSYNRAIAGLYPPGSTFKPLVGLSGLEEGIINKNTIINDPGMYIEEGVKMTCLEWRRGEGEHGDLVLKSGLKTSCNVFFYRLGTMIGIDSINKWAKKLGLGERTGIDIPGEAKGTRSTPEYHYELFDYKFGKVMTSYSSIGQGYNLYTPVQLVKYTSALANGGKEVNPHLVKNISNDTGTEVIETEIKVKDIGIKKESLSAVRDGMIAVTTEEGGTATNIFTDFVYKVAAKTGTAQTYSSSSDNAVFIAYAPADDPKIAVAIVIEKGVYGSYSAPVARDIFTEYFKENVKSETGNNINENEFLFTE